MEKGGYWGMKKKLTPAARKRGVVGWLCCQQWNGI